MEKCRINYKTNARSERSRAYYPRTQKTNISRRRIKKLGRQTIVSLIMLSILLVIKNTNDFATNTIRKYMSYNISVQELVNKLNETTNKIKKIDFESINKLEAINNILYKDKAEVNHNDRNIDHSNKYKSCSSYVCKEDDGAGNIDYTGLRQQQIQNDTAVIQVEQSKDSDKKNTSFNEEQKVHQKNLNRSSNADPSPVLNRGMDILPDKHAPKMAIIPPIYGKVAITSGFGKRIHPIKKTVDFHKGIDILANHGDRIRAVEDGEIIEARLDKTYGKYIRIRHKDKIQTLYAHCSKLLVSPGQKISKGQEIAKVGATGSVDGPHLHFEIINDGKPINPLQYIKATTK